MAIVFKAERFPEKSPEEVKFYIDPNEYQFKENSAPFLQNSQRFSEPPKEPESGGKSFQKDFCNIIDDKKKLIYNCLKMVKKGTKKDLMLTSKRFGVINEFMDPGQYQRESQIKIPNTKKVLLKSLNQMNKHKGEPSIFKIKTLSNFEAEKKAKSPPKKSLQFKGILDWKKCSSE